MPRWRIDVVSNWRRSLTETDYTLLSEHELLASKSLVALWKAEPTLTIKAIVERNEIQRLGGAAPYQAEIVARWISDLDAWLASRTVDAGAA